MNAVASPNRPQQQQQQQSHSEHVATAFIDRDIQRRLLAIEESADNGYIEDVNSAAASNGSNFMPSSALNAGWYRRDSTSFYPTASVQSGLPAGTWPRVSGGGSRPRGQIAAGGGARKPVAYGSGDGSSGNWAVDDICPWPVSGSCSVGGGQQVAVKVAKQRTSTVAAACDPVERRESVALGGRSVEWAIAAAQTAASAAAAGPTGASRQCACATATSGCGTSATSGASTSQQQSGAFGQTVQRDIPYVFRHWLANSSDDEVDEKSRENCRNWTSGDVKPAHRDNGDTDERSPARRLYIDQYRAEYTYPHVIRDFEPEALRWNFVVSTDERRSASDGDCGRASSGDNISVLSNNGPGSRQAPTMWAAAVSRVDVSTTYWDVPIKENGILFPVPNARNQQCVDRVSRSLSASKRTHSDPGFRQVLSEAGNTGGNYEVEGKGDAERHHRHSNQQQQHRHHSHHHHHHHHSSTPVAVVTPVQFAQRKISTSSVPATGPSKTPSPNNDTIVDDSLPHSGSHMPQSQQRLQQPDASMAVGHYSSNSAPSSGVATRYPTLTVTVTSKSSSNQPTSESMPTVLPPRITLEPPLQTPSLPRVTGCSSGIVPTASASAPALAAVATVGDPPPITAVHGTAWNRCSFPLSGSKDDSLSAAAADTLVNIPTGSSSTPNGNQFIGKTMKPIPSHGYSIDNHTSRRQSSNAASQPDGLRTLDLLVQLSSPDRLQLQSSQKEADEVRHLMWFGSKCDDCLHGVPPKAFKLQKLRRAPLFH